MSIELPGDERVVEERLRRGFGAAGKRGRELEELAEELAGEASREQVLRALERLQQEGEAVEWNRRWIAVRFTDWVAGRVESLERGDAVVRAEEGSDWFVKRRNLKGALEGDLVLVRPAKGRKRERIRRIPEATVVRVLRRRLRSVVGTLDIGGERRWLVPFDPKANLEVVVEGGDELLEDHYVVVELQREGRAAKGPLAGRVVEVLGDPEQPGVDVDVVLRHFEIPDSFPRAVLAEAEKLPSDPSPAEFRGRRDLRRSTLVTIDGATARDFDDAISVESAADGGFRLGVHIADVAAYVPEGGALDLEAYRRGTSVYYPDRAIPMLPEKLSNGLCSLRPGVPRLAVSVFLTIGADGEVTDRRFAETVIRSARRLTYDEVRRLLEEPRRGDSKEYGEVLEVLRRARRLMKLLLRRRLDRGSIDFDLPEGDVILDSEGFTVGVRPGQRTAAHRIVEEFMIAANEAVAQELTGLDSPALYRVHEPPRREDLEELRAILRGVGISLKGDLENLHPSALQKALQRAEGGEEEAFVSSLVLRSMMRAVYHPEGRGHYALGSRHYTHFTSPIRRYPDLVVHRRLKAALGGRREPEAELDRLRQRLERIAQHASSTERRAEKSERVLMQWKLVRFLADRVGESFAGRVTGVHPFGLFVQLEDWYVDGLVPIRALGDDFYEHDEEAHQLVGRERGRVFRLADRVEVVLRGVDARIRGLQLEIAGISAPKTRRDRAGRPGRGRRP